MATRLLSALCFALLAFSTAAQTAASYSFTTLNCLWFLGQESGKSTEKPRTGNEYVAKAANLINLLPTEPPFFVALQEVGNFNDVSNLAKRATYRYRRTYTPLFAQGKDTYTQQDVGALFDGARGWSVVGKASRASDLEKNLSKHLVVRLTNSIVRTSIDVCVIHLRRPLDDSSESKHVEQNRALLRWAMGHLAQNPKANLVILGDFNEGKPVGSAKQDLAVLFQAKPPLVDTLTLAAKPLPTHTDGKAYDRIMLSDSLVKGLAGLRFSAVFVNEHEFGKDPVRRRIYTDHFPLTVRLVGR
ncbi:MAG: hypothetical protein HZA89_01495 [Verrucomicrobia bacterium]|nr:hypothetical protein [Verrucomicrobiota bacterium]